MKTGCKILVVCLLMLPLGAMGQFNKGSKFIGGYVNYRVNASPDNPSYQNTLTVSPAVGFLMSDNLALGLDVGVGYSFFKGSTTPLGTNMFESKSLSMGVSVARYMPLGDRFWFSIGGRVGYGRTNIEDSFPSGSLNGNDYYTIEVSARPAFLFFPNEKWAVTMGIGGVSYVHNHAVDSNESDNTLSFTLGQLGFGVLYFF